MEIWETSEAGEVAGRIDRFPFRSQRAVVQTTETWRLHLLPI